MTIEIRELAAADAAGLVDCFTRCYGDSYANDLFYDQPELETTIIERRLRSVVAISDGVLVGHTGLTIRHPDALVPEAGNTVVDPAMRGQGLLGQLGGALRELTIRDGFVGYVHYPTTAHEIMQKAATSGTGRETGIMLDYIPAETEYLDIDQPGGRIAATIVYQPLADAPATKSFVPERYESLIGTLAESLELDRVFDAGPRTLNTAGEVTISMNSKRGVTQVMVDKIGQSALDEIIRLDDVPLVLVDLPMDNPTVGPAADHLLNNGYRYCGWLPGFAGCDILRLQKLDFDRVDQPRLVTTEAVRLFELIQQDSF